MSDPTPTRRLFFALWPSDELRARIAATAAAAVERSRGRATAHANLHVTTLFLGAVPEPRVDEVRAIGDSVHGAPFELQFDQLENWPGANVLCLTCTRSPAELTRLHEDLRNALATIGFQFRDQPFSPHITLARNTPPRRRREPFAPLLWSVDDFVLVQSNMTRTGSQYEVIQRWALSEEATSH